MHPHSAHLSVISQALFSYSAHPFLLCLLSSLSIDHDEIPQRLKEDQGLGDGGEEVMDREARLKGMLLEVSINPDSNIPVAEVYWGSKELVEFCE